ncbi:GNAT family N-acetyltransferase [Aurantiacibacter hainanensis]|uniref:GNAT family N-acetyltransferase n=1 Tax=Aurantiacibacter hainanensis TaxID=3076114 RepID=UPI0030C68815
MKLRPALATERQAVAAVHTASWRDSYRDLIDPGYLADIDRRMALQWEEKAIGADDLLLVAETDQIAGFLFARGGDPAFINSLHVLPGQRSQGIGARLMAEAARRFLDAGSTGAYLDVLTTNHRAIALYQRLGGIPGAVKAKEVGGVMLPNLRIDFPDLRAIIAAA